MKSNYLLIITAYFLTCCVGNTFGQANSGRDTGQTPGKVKSANELQARRLLDEAKAKILSIPALIVDVEIPKFCGLSASKGFEKSHVLTLQRPNLFRIERIDGVIEEVRQLVAVSDGQKITRLDENNFAAYEKPVRADSFFMGQNFMVQFFFSPKPISFDSSDRIWNRTISVFEKSALAYDKDTIVRYLGKTTRDDIECDVIEIRYNTQTLDIRQQIYLDPDRMVCEVHSSLGGPTFFEKYRNYQTKFGKLESGAFKLIKSDKMPVVATDPVTLGAVAPDFKLPGAKGEESIALKEILSQPGTKGVLIFTLNGEVGQKWGPDVHLAQMQLLQTIRDKFEKQGLQIVCVVGGPKITPDLKDTMLLNWLPNLTRFNYPIAIDIDVERGIQGSAFENFNLNGRNTVLLDKEGKVVFSSFAMGGAFGATDRSFELALYQSLAQIGFSVSQAELDGLAAASGP